MPKDEIIQKGSTVKFHYTLLSDGQIVDSSRKEEPIEYQHGEGKILRGLESRLEGLKAGDHEEIKLGPEEAFGPSHPGSVVDIPRTEFPEGEIEIGMAVKGRGKDGQPVRGVVKDVSSEAVKVDFNHPLAGKELVFVVDVIQISN